MNWVSDSILGERIARVKRGNRIYAEYGDHRGYGEERPRGGGSVSDETYWDL